MAYPQSCECEMELGRPVATELPWQLAGEVAPGGARVPPGATENDEVAVRSPDRSAETVNRPVAQVERVDLETRRRRERRVERHARGREMADCRPFRGVEQLPVGGVAVALPGQLARTPVRGV